MRQLQGSYGNYEPIQSTPGDLALVLIFVHLEKNSLTCLVEVARKVVQHLSDLHRGHASLEDAELTLNPPKPREQ